MHFQLELNSDLLFLENKSDITHLLYLWCHHSSTVRHKHEQREACEESQLAK